MAVTRRALLISNPGETGAENYCKGVYVDIANYKRILTAATGGYWYPSEIDHLDRPSAVTVRGRIASLKDYDYVFIMFSGHGYYSKQAQDRILECREGQEISSLELIQGAKKRTVILDCCQKVEQEEKKFIAKAAQLSLESRGRQPNAVQCRKLFDDQITAAPISITRMMSCAIGEVSTDDDTRGGRYNGSLIESFDDWGTSQRTSQSNSNNTLSIVSSHEYAAIRTIQLSGKQQNPTIEKAKSGPYFPFAVFA